MDAGDLFDTLADQEQPPMRVDVGRARSVGRAIRRRRRAVAAAVSALSVCAAVTVTWLGLPQLGQRDEVAVAVPTAAEPEPSGAEFRKLKEKYPPVGRIASTPEIPVWLWLGRQSADRGGAVLCHVWDPGDAFCTGFPPLGAEEFARTQGASPSVLDARVRALHPDATPERPRERQEQMQALGNIFFGVARTEVHGITAVTPDGRRFPGSVERRAGAGLGVWAVKFPPDVATAALVFTDASGKTLQRIREG